MRASIAIVDYGMGNRRSVEKAIARAGGTPVLSADPATIRAAQGLIVPGVGAFPAAMAALAQRGLLDVVRERAQAGVPLLGCCLGMQLLFERSREHGGAEGLGLLPGEVELLDARGLRLPHIGWNEVRWTRPTALAAGLPDPATFYHVHSYVARAPDEVVIAYSDHGSEFASVVGAGRVFGCQFHPEKSSDNGLALLRNFVALCAEPAGVPV